MTFLSEHQAVVPFQREIPVQANDGAERTTSYGDGTESPVTHQLAFFGFRDGHTEETTAEIAQHQPRALAWDQAHDALYVAGIGNDSLVQIKNASQASIAAGLSVTLTSGSDRCGPDGLAITAAGNVLVWCSFTRSVAQVEFVDPHGALASITHLTAGPALVATAMTAKQHQGLVLFHSAEPQISQSGSLACASCHPITGPTACPGGSIRRSSRRRSCRGAWWARIRSSGMARMRRSATAISIRAEHGGSQARRSRHETAITASTSQSPHGSKGRRFSCAMLP